MPSRSEVEKKTVGKGAEISAYREYRNTSSHSKKSRVSGVEMDEHSSRKNRHHRRSKSGKSKSSRSKGRKSSRERHKDRESYSYESAATLNRRRRHRHRDSSSSDEDEFSKHRVPIVGGRVKGSRRDHRRLWKPPSTASDLTSDQSSTYTMRGWVTDDEEVEDVQHVSNTSGSISDSEAPQSPWRSVFGRLRGKASGGGQVRSRSESPTRSADVVVDLRDEASPPKTGTQPLGQRLSHKFASLQAHLPLFRGKGSADGSGHSQLSIKRYVKKGGIRKLHTGILFSIDVWDGPIGIRITERSKEVKGHVGFEVERVAKAGMAVRGGVKKHDVLVAIGDGLLALDMGWEEAQSRIMAAPRPLRITFFRRYSSSEVQRMKARGDLAELSCLCAKPTLSGQRTKGEELLCEECGGSVPQSAGSTDLLTDSLKSLRAKRASATKYLAKTLQRNVAWHVLGNLHSHRLYYLQKLPTNMHWCDTCSTRILGEAFRCRTCDFDVCLNCLLQHMPLHPLADVDDGAMKRKKKEHRRLSKQKHQGESIEGYNSDDSLDGSKSRRHRKSKHKSGLERTNKRMVDAVLVLPKLHDHGLIQVRYKVSSKKRHRDRNPGECDNCDRTIEDDFFQCASCDFVACTDCTTDASIPTSSSHYVRSLHKHVVGFQEATVSEDGSVHWCNNCRKQCKDFVFRCKPCDFDCCVHCFYVACGPPIYHPNDLIAATGKHPRRNSKKSKAKGEF